MLPWAYEADSLSGNLLFFCRILFCNGLYFFIEGCYCGLTARGLSFLPLVDNLIEWAKDNMDEIVEGRRRRGLE